MVAKVVQVGELDISLAGTRASARFARRLVRARLLEWRLDGVVDDVLLVAGELAANAVENAAGQEIRVRLTRVRGGVRLAVWDSSGHMPRVRPMVTDLRPDPRALEPGHEEGGRGLQIVRALASECGFTMTMPVGKWVWAEVSC